MHVRSMMSHVELEIERLGLLRTQITARPLNAESFGTGTQKTVPWDRTMVRLVLLVGRLTSVGSGLGPGGLGARGGRLSHLSVASSHGL